LSGQLPLPWWKRVSSPPGYRSMSLVPALFWHAAGTETFREELQHTDRGSQDGPANNHGKRYGQVLRVVEERQEQTG
jgi:hypothetical protein